MTEPAVQHDGDLQRAHVRWPSRLPLLTLRQQWMLAAIVFALPLPLEFLFQTLLRPAPAVVAFPFVVLMLATSFWPALVTALASMWACFAIVVAQSVDLASIPAGDKQRLAMNIVAAFIVAIAAEFSWRLRSQAADAIRALRAGYDLLTTILGTTVTGIVVCDPQGNITFANPGAEQILGLTRSAITKRRYDAPEFRPTAIDGGPWPDEAQPFRRVLESRSVVRGVRHAIDWPDGRRVLLEINGAPIFDSAGRITSLVFSVEDITERVQRTEQLDGVVAAMPGVVYKFIREPDGRMRFEYMGGRVRELLGVEPVAPLELTQELVARMHPDDQPPFLQSIEHSAARLSPWVLDFRLRPPGGEERWLRGSSIPRPQPDGSIAWNGVLLDVTEMKRLERQFLQSQKMEAVGRLASGVAHDFNNILTVMHTSLQLAERQLATGESVQEDFAELAAAVARARDLTSRLLGFTRRTPSERQLLDLREVLEAAMPMLRRIVGPEVRLELEAGTEPLPIRGDPNQLELMLLNLAANARDAMPEGGLLSLRCRVDDHEPASELLVLEVRDTGTGMDEATKARLFEPFFTTKPAGKGTGLGLATVYTVMQAHQGAVQVFSAPGEGTTFHLRLPLEKTPRA